MLQTIRLQTLDGIREYPILPSAAALQAAADAGEISVGDEIVYREFIVLVLEDYELLILDRIPAQVMNMGPEFVPPMGDGVNMQFFVNGQPVDPAQFMNRGAAQ